MRIRTVNGKRKMKRSVKRKNKKVDYLQEDSKLKSGMIRKKIPIIGMGLLMFFIEIDKARRGFTRRKVC